jgi:predicted Zn-dependent protease
LKIAHDQIERKFIKLSLGILVGLILFIVLCWGGWRAYTAWEQRHLVRRAIGYMSGDNLKEAALCVRRAWQIGPNADAARIMAQIGERTGDRAAVDWRRQVLQLAPASTEDALALVSSALRFNDLVTAERALSMVNEREHDSAAFHAAAARVAEMKQHPEEAERHWQRAAELAPNDKSHELQLALTRLRSSDPTRRASGRASLENLRKEPSYRAQATRALIGYAVANHESVTAIRDLARELQAYPERLLADRLLYLDVLRQAEDPAFASYLTSVENDVASNPSDLANLLSWMNATGQAALAIDFARGLAAEQVNAWPVPLALAESYGNLADWAGLERLTKNADWGRLNFLRQAFLVRAYRATHKDVAAEHEWAAAKKQAATAPETLSLLMHTVSPWRWKNEVVELLWTLTKFPEKQRDALQTLYRQYNSEHDSQGLYRVTARLAELNPGDLTLQNNLAQISLLLGVDIERAQKIATAVYHKEPKNPAYVSTYAFALFSKGDAVGAVRVMDTLIPEQLRTPEVGTYYGVFLAAAGEATKAKEFLAFAESGKLLPEERALVEQGKKRAGLQ